MINWALTDKFEYSIVDIICCRLVQKSVNITRTWFSHIYEYTIATVNKLRV